ncbi:metallophosphoesterase [Xanthobacter sp. YC-JY1]|uniref:metallophosphoesterase family protein n=1 Tax=Xanthobacter sp. YC-JY1 TaxID=2419844 RepID=UPI001F20849C|nr:metallophosphoesterase [Xanthobacter sp. YC-JY1]UJX46592.1 DNA repair exonuclease [Xanthobacter sp. YC-JY1]
MRFIHTSDWQLGKPFGRVPEEARTVLREARLDAIDRLAAAARANGAPLVLVAGDVFDSPEPGDRVYRQALNRMKAQADVRFLLLPGNHDPLRADGLWSRLAADTPANVSALVEAQPLDLGTGSDEAAVLLPAPLSHKRSVADPTQWFDAAETPSGALRIGLAHGSVQTFGGDADPNLVAVDRARRAGLAYLALGDWHGRIKIDERTYYSGTPEPDDFGREVTGVALLVDVSGSAPPQVTELPIGRHHWLEEGWTLSGADDIEARISGLAPGAARQDLVCRLRLSGLVTLAERVAVRRRLEDELAHEVRWLDLIADDLVTRPTDTDLSEIDAQGELHAAAMRLRAMMGEGGAEGRLAAQALERLYVEQMRAQRAGEA